MILKYIFKDMYSRGQILIYIILYFILVYFPFLSFIYFSLIKLTPINYFNFLFTYSTLGSILWMSFILILTNIFVIILRIYTGNSKINLYGNITYSKSEIDFILSSDFNIKRYILYKSLSFLFFIYFIILPFFLSYIYFLFYYHHLTIYIIIFTLINSFIFSFLVSFITYLPENIIKKVIYSLPLIILLLINLFYPPEINIFFSRYYSTIFLILYLLLIYLLSRKSFTEFYLNAYTIYSEEVPDLFKKKESIFKKDPIKEMSNIYINRLIIFSLIFSFIFFLYYLKTSYLYYYSFFLLLYTISVGLEMSIGFERLWINAGNYYFLNYIIKKMKLRMINSYKIIFPWLIILFLLFLIKKSYLFLFSIYSLILLPIIIVIPSWYYVGKLNPQYKGFIYDRQFTRLDFKQFLMIIILSIFIFISLIPLFINNILYSTLSFIILLLIFLYINYRFLNRKSEKYWYKFLEDLIKEDYS
ncbi:hypothetical protein YN1_4000 [Nanoarchaeota archaeon]